MADEKEEALKDAMSDFADHAQAALRASAAGKAESAAIAQHHAQAACDRAVDLLEGIMASEEAKGDG